MTEATEPEPCTVYQGTKLAAEALLHAAVACTADLRATVLRVSLPEPVDKMAVDARRISDA